MTRSTTTGAVLEAMILPALDRGGYEWRVQAETGTRPGGRKHAADAAYLVLGGDGWSLRDYYVSGALADHLIHARLVNVVTLEAFVRLANNGQL